MGITLSGAKNGLAGKRSGTYVEHKRCRKANFALFLKEEGPSPSNQVLVPKAAAVVFAMP
jgi:hypothetical protein